MTPKMIATTTSGDAPGLCEDELPGSGVVKDVLFARWYTTIRLRGWLVQTDLVNDGITMIKRTGSAMRNVDRGSI